jgi:predicted Zn-dependent protease
LRDYHDPALMEMRDADLVGAGWDVLESALRAFESSEDLAVAAPDGDIRRMNLVLGGDVTVLQERMAIASTRMPGVQSDESTLLLSFATAMVEREESKGNGWAAASSLASFDGGAGRAAAENAIRSMNGVRVPSGEYNVVFGPQAVSDLLNNLIVPSLNLSTFQAYQSAFQGKLGAEVAAPGLRIYDDGSARGRVGSKGITCEGLPTGGTQLIDNGRLVGLLANHYEFRRILGDPAGREKLGADPADWRQGLLPRNGFRFARGGGRHFDAQPGIAGTNVVVESTSPASHDDVLRAAGDGLYIGRIWYTYPVNGLRAGDFTCTVVADSFRIKDGRLAEPLRANSLRISDNIVRLLGAVLAVGADTRPTVVWAADEIMYAPEIAVSAVPMQEIGTFLAGGG